MSIGYNEFAAQAKQMRDQLVAAATEEADHWLDATLAMLRRMPGSSTGSNERPKDGDRQTAIGDRGGNGASLTTAVRKAIISMDKDEFDTKELRRLVEPNYHPMETSTERSNLANLLRRMVDRGELELTEQGKGPKPSRFRKARISGQLTGDNQG